MNPLCNFRDWSVHDAEQLLKVKGTIQDVDGECSLKVTGKSRKACPIPAQYRLPMYALNKKFGIYRKIVQHLQKSSSEGAANLRDTYLSVMKYLHDVRIAFMEDSGGSSDPLNGTFRSAALDYYLWLDHTTYGFHEECRTTLLTSHGVSFEGLKNGDCPDILVFLDWTVYHQDKCKEHDLCGALQTSGQGEDIKCLMNQVDALVNAAVEPISTIKSVQLSNSGNSSAEMMVLSQDLDVTPSQFPMFPLPFDRNCRNISLRTLGSNAREVLIGGFGKWLPSHVAMRFREIQGLDHDDPLDKLVDSGLLVTARNVDEYLEIFGMVEMMATCKELLVDRAAMAQFFITAGRALYKSHSGKECVVEYGNDLGPINPIETLEISRINGKAHIEDCGDSQNVHMDSLPPIVVTVGVQCEPIIECTLSLPSIRSLLDHGVQTDIEVQEDLVMDDSSYLLLNHRFECGGERPPHSQEYVDEINTDDDKYILSSTTHSDEVGDISHSTSILLEASITVDPEVNYTSSPSYHSSFMCDINSSNEHHSSQGRDALSQIPDLPISPPLKSRLRQNNQALKANTPVAASQRRGASRPARPVVFATQGRLINEKADIACRPSRSQVYTIQDLLHECQPGVESVTPSISCFLVDPKGINFVRSTMESNHDSWLVIVRHVASLLRSDCMSSSMNSMAASLMSIDMWIKDISIECQKTILNRNGDHTLPPLAHCVLVELSSRSMLDEESVRSTLHSLWTQENVKCLNEVLRYLLRVCKPNDSDPYAPGFKVLASVMQERTSSMLGNNDIRTK
ncbi:uncharacterized protein HD556DRAFT_1451705 [Suillus plorans]|uniref:Uncharacterized protein n=1 Tax=Suillus plorans TaxID=116603 RepID=A0A9P7A8X9_9AGAM|nr:uncharacterized protein HD556DRAFT_1451705 [Suillus plorans]KAG1784506.1 hypothetical protein HD556DRAFT_1451705 [Suillus plorans]